MIASTRPSMSRRGFLLSSSGILTGAAVAMGCASSPTKIVKRASRVREKHRHPVVVIGAGLGSLTAAAYFAKAGFPVTVVEQSSAAGGYASSFERHSGRHRYRFEVSLHMSAVTSSSSAEILRELGLSKLEVVPLPELCRIIAPRHDVTLPQADPEGCIRALAGQCPAESAGMTHFLNEIIGVADETKKLRGGVSFLDRVLFPFRFPRLRRMYNRTLADVLDRHVGSDEAKSLLSVFWDYYGLPPSRLSGFYYAVGTGQFIKGGGYYYKPRSQALSNALVGLIESRGGRVMFNREVSGIGVQDGAVTGTRLRDGERLPARTVVSGASGPATFKHLLPGGSLPDGYAEKISSFKNSLSSFVVWLGIDRDITDRLKTYETFLMNEYDPEAAYRAQLSCDPTRAGIVVTVFDNAFEGYSEPGTSTVSLMFTCGYGPWKRFEADYFAGRKEAYNAAKERIAKTLIARAEAAVLPGLSDMIDLRVIATPLTNIRYTGNPSGAIYGYEQSLENAFNRRLDNRTPIDGLYLAGSWSFPGGGFTGCQSSGRRAFAQFLGDTA